MWIRILAAMLALVVVMVCVITLRTARENAAHLAVLEQRTRTLETGFAALYDSLEERTVPRDPAASIPAAPSSSATGEAGSTNGPSALVLVHLDDLDPDYVRAGRLQPSDVLLRYSSGRIGMLRALDAAGAPLILTAAARRVAHEMLVLQERKEKLIDEHVRRELESGSPLVMTPEELERFVRDHPDAPHRVREVSPEELHVVRYPPELVSAIRDLEESITTLGKGLDASTYVLAALPVAE